MSKNKQSVWQTYPELTEYLIECIVEQNILDGSKLLELILEKVKELGIKEKITINSVQSKKAHLAKTNTEVKARFKAQRQKELIEEKHHLREAIMRGRWLSVIGIEEDIDFSQYIPPNSSAKEPIIIDVKDEESPKVAVVNAPLIGSLVEMDESRDIFMNSLRYHQESGVDCLVITGDVIFMLAQKWGTQKPRKAYTIGIQPDPKIIKEAYPDAVLAEKSIEDRLSDGDIIFTTVKARLDMVMQELHRVFRDKNDKPIFKGNTYIVTGESEEQISTFYANEIVRLLVRQEQDSAQRQIELLRHEWRHEEDERRKDNLRDAISDWSMYKGVLSYMSNAEDTYVKKITEQMVGYISKKIQEVIPNSTIVGRGDAYLHIGKTKWFVTREKAATAYRGVSAGNIREKTLTHIKNTPGLNIPDVILVGGLNPYWTTLFVTHFIPELAGSLDDRQMTHIVQLPTALSAGRYREELRNFSEVKGNIEKVGAVSDFESGATILRWVNPGNFLVTDWLKSDFLTNDEIFGFNGQLKSVISGSNKKSRVIYNYKQGCEHAGARFITQYKSPNDPNGRIVKSHFQVIFEALIKSKAPIHMYQSDGDTLHWANYAVHKEGFPDSRLSLEEFLDTITELSTDESLSHKARQHKTALLAYEHAISEGVMQPDGQLDFYQYLLRPVKQFFYDIELRARESGLVIIGPRLGSITQGQGNHNENSFRTGHVNISEAEFVRRGILLELLEGVSLKDQARLKKAVVAAVFSDIGEARGMFGIPLDSKKEYTKEEILRLGNQNGYFYALYMMHKQGGSKTKDNMAPMIKAFRNRLTDDQYEVNRFSINLAGDDHIGGCALTRTALHFKSGCQMGGNSFGRKSSFPEQNIFSAGYGTPVGGPQWAPITVMTFDHRFARHYADEPFDLPVKELFRNPA